MYFEEPENAAPVAAGVDLKLILSINGLLIVWLGVFPQSLIGLSNQAIIGFP
jgi:NADH-quinone oxidoreductase subunit N